MQSYLAASAKTAVSLHLLTPKTYGAWLKKQSAAQQQWLKACGFKGDVGKFALLPEVDGKLKHVVAIIAAKPDLWSLAHLPCALPNGAYKPTGEVSALADMALGWQLATYKFDAFKNEKAKPCATLIVPATCNIAEIEALAEGIFLARDLINRPANDLTPYALAEVAQTLAKKHKAKCSVIKDEALLDQNYPLIHAVGRASDNRPCLVDMRWGNAKHPKVTLVGKGICFDSGGLDIKSSGGMLLMKKDMGGAANVLALAQAIMAAKLPINLRVLIPAAENSVAGNAFRPKDIITSRKGVTVEIGNTDAEGRLVLCDAICEADSEKPDLLIDFATLTGAARVALGTDVPAFFSNDDALAAALAKSSKAANDPLWQLPLWHGYRDMLDSDVADLNNAPAGGFGGAITAALYLNEFVDNCKHWLHIDLMAWNTKSRAGRPAGGEAMGIRAVLHLLRQRYGSQR